jgi:hypothetical protein
MDVNAPGAKAKGYPQAGAGAIFASIASLDSWELTKAMKLRQFLTGSLRSKKSGPRAAVYRATRSRDSSQRRKRRTLRCVPGKCLLSQGRRAPCCGGFGVPGGVLMREVRHNHNCRCGAVHRLILKLKIRCQADNDADIDIPPAYQEQEGGIKSTA